MGTVRRTQISSICLLCLLFIAGFAYRSLWMKLPSDPNFGMNSPSCNNLGPASLEQELHVLMKAIEWPEPPGPIDYEFSTSPFKTEFHMPFPRATYYVGEYVEVLITARDQRGQPKTYGGDYFQAKLHSPKLKAGVTGSVTDHRNGTYTASFLLLWPGQVEISIRLVHSSEAIAILKDKRETRPDKVSYFGYFYGTSEKTECNVELLGPNVCEYNDIYTGESWFCKRPKQISCSAYKGHSMAGNRNVLTAREAKFLNQSVREKLISSKVGAFIVLHPKNKTALQKQDIFGKSPVPQLAIDTTHKFVVQWQVHQKPVTMQYIDKEELHYIANDLDKIGGSKEGLVIVINCLAHFVSFSNKFYVRRLLTIRDAVLRLVQRNPLVKVFIKSGNTGYLYSHGSDWLSLQLDLIMRAMFSSLPVTILDAWQITSCHYEPQLLHPGPVIVKNQIDLMLSFICPTDEETTS
ncbi:NXPE family member 3-like isoform X2 [Xenopus laevis]|nr:NXPE family member 3-like isoform X2 [Xenopus laevis]